MADVNNDPSMEEILASIKKVIAEEVPPPSSRARARRVEAGEAEDVLELNQPADIGEPLMSDNAAQSSRHALSTLSEIAQQNPLAAVGEGPLEAVVRDMLRPLLKQWLDERLPEMVEDMVKREIARITGRDI
ncbi:DUF2497 domain-containing protein [Allosphingosinicella flava]|uniref:DUF2497 domain-containing protein n=1 Tax=Allosphingosinicella flava TaxID=2771430 RepID=A0A7T2GK72_9SPHN|nr:DUF2497 domain-containing protein [Sphingosinicella flava]QPQ55371.1 DUF2497 domain-containing protein [Sphingosinicella flava]